ncbi:hypothetical protein [Patulibacter sp.]|uniref:hypothetical protein n=1 Tax=Patulibacter sp. TaxID=1912859 RepID=UPI00272141B7|nr:hypothetical protein [Patulibacter sp.]MDO9407347.1 hypothetical protein [Patulibacter sp.]
MTQTPGALHPRPVTRDVRAPRSLFDILGTLGPAPGPSDDAAPFRAACVLEAARRGRPAGPPRPTPHGAAPPAG